MGKYCNIFDHMLVQRNCEKDWLFYHRVQRYWPEQTISFRTGPPFCQFIIKVKLFTSYQIQIIQFICRVVLSLSGKPSKRYEELRFLAKWFPKTQMLWEAIQPWSGKVSLTRKNVPWSICGKQPGEWGGAASEKNQSLGTCTDTDSFAI